MIMKDVVLVDGVRTPIGRMGSSLASLRVEDLSTVVMKEVINKTGLDPAQFGDVIWGMALKTGTALSLARWAALKAGVPVEVPATTIERQCISGLQALIFADQAIKAGSMDLALVGGAESWSALPYFYSKLPTAYSLTPPLPIPPEPAPDEYNVIMGLTGENLVEKYGISREEQDEFALRSHQKAVKAIDDGIMAEEIVPVPVFTRKGPAPVDTDECPRRETSLETLAKLPPVFKRGGTITAGNASGLNDGACALIVASAEKAARLGLKPLTRVVASAVVGVDPRIMGIGPAWATPKVLALTGLSFEDLDVIECNEAFACQNLAVIKELKNQGLEVDMAKWNPNGGAVALGHPNAMSGARLALTVSRELVRRRKRYGLVTICAGGGMGVATIFENVQL
ncbi:MAG: thiolase family protein [Pseudomonadota bacterium]